MIKRTFLSWVDFTLLNDLNQCIKPWVILVNSNLINNHYYQTELREISVCAYGTYNTKYVIGVFVQGIKPVLQSQAEKLNSVSYPLGQGFTSLTETTGNM